MLKMNAMTSHVRTKHHMLNCIIYMLLLLYTFLIWYAHRCEVSADLYAQKQTETVYADTCDLSDALQLKHMLEECGAYNISVEDKPSHILVKGRIKKIDELFTVLKKPCMFIHSIQFTEQIYHFSIKIL